MSSANIELRMGTPVCFTEVKKSEIERSMPAVLNGYMSNSEWESFCNAVNKAMEHITTSLKVLQICWILQICWMFYTMGNVLESLDHDDVKGVPIVVLAVPLGLFLVLGLGSPCYVAAVRNRAHQRITKICQDMSKTNPRVSLHLRVNLVPKRLQECRQVTMHSFIEVSINSDNTGTKMDGPDSLYVKYGTASFLEEVKHLISPQDYEEKRTALLMNV